MRRAHQAGDERGGGVVRAQGPDLRGVAGRGDVLHGVGEGEVRVALQVARVQDDVLEGVAVRADELAAEVIEREAELADAGPRLDFQCVGVKAGVAAREVNHAAFGMLGAGDLAGDEAAGDVDVAVEAERGMAHAELRGAGGSEAGEEDASYVRATVAVRVLEVKNVRCAGDDEAAAPAHEAVREGEAGGELGALVVGPVAVGVLQHGDDAGRRLVRAGADGVAAILRDEHPPAFIPRDGAR